ncbi:MAG: hypothetical protein AAB214_19365, partial [Fibrobacterota bacterium]
ILSEINGDGFRWARPHLVDSGTVLEVEIQLPNGIHITGAKALVVAETNDTGTTYRARFSELSEIDRSEIEKLVLSTNRLRRLGTPET